MVAYNPTHRFYKARMRAAINPSHLFYQSRKMQPTIDRAKGVFMWDETGKSYLDGCSGAVVSNIGYGDSRILEAIQKQAESTFFAYRLQFENRPARELAADLVDVTAPHLDRVFFVSGGSEAMETAMKLCRQFYYNSGEAGRHIFISRIPSYHGCTLGALSLTSAAPLEAPHRPLYPAWPKIPAPNCYRCSLGLTYPECGVECAQMLDTVIREQGPANVAAFVVEPIGGASTGAVVPPKEYFDIIYEICREYGVMLILDEVMTGFGRTGKMFAYEHWNVQADIIALSKGMASGYYPLGAVMARSSIVETVLDSGGFVHGFTHAGNPMACAVGQEVLRIIREDRLVENSARMGELLISGLRKLAETHDIIGSVRGRGLLTAIELVADRENRAPFAPPLFAAQRLSDIAFEEGLILYPRRTLNGLAGDHVLVAPPLIISESEVESLLGRLDVALARATESLRIQSDWEKRR